MMKNRPYKTFHLLLWPVLAASFLLCCGKKGSPEPPRPAVVDTAATEVSRVFGFDGQQKYAYCPSVICAGTERHIWFCGNEPAGIFSDHIYYVRGDIAGTPKIVLAPGASGSWDDRHVCDPDVIKGQFNYNGTIYPYALFYLGNRSDRYYNEIGVAFAQTMDADRWIKYPAQLIPKTWPGDNDLPIGSGNAWGVGQPSVLSLDGKGKVLLSYTIGDADGTRVVVRQADLSDMANIQLSAPHTVSTTGLTKLDYSTQNIILSNADIAFDSSRTTVFMTSAVLPTPASYPDYIPEAVDLNKMPYNDFINGVGHWELVQRIGPAISTYPRNHNSALGRDAYGAVPDLKNAEHYFTVSKATPDVSLQQNAFAEWSYQLYVSKNIDLTK